jgi:Protein of unknown function (DUF3618)
MTDTEALREEIAGTRQALADTVQALADKADVKARARGKMRESRAQVGQTVTKAQTTVRARPVPFAAGGALVAGIVAGALLRGRK